MRKFENLFQSVGIESLEMTKEGWFYYCFIFRLTETFFTKKGRPH